jgi:hypothetical protein
MTRKSGCPGCRHGKPRSLTEGETGSIREPERSKIKRAGTDVAICGYCGCVFARTSRHIYGEMDGMSGPGWVPARRATP